MTTLPTTKTYARTDVVDEGKAAELFDQYIEIAFSPSDNSWTKHDTKDERIRVDYKQIGDSAFWTTRGTMKIEGSIHDYYNYCCAGFKDIWEGDNGLTEGRIVCCIDDDRSICYLSQNSGFFMVAARDMLYHRTRFQIENYGQKKAGQSKSATADDNEYPYVCGTLCFSIVDEKHPFFVKVKDKHVRALIKYSGYVCRKISDTEFEATYILCMDPGGWIPALVINQFCASKGMTILKFHDCWPSIVQRVQRRVDNNFQRDYQIMFDVPTATKDEQEAEKKQNNNNNN